MPFINLIWTSPLKLLVQCWWNLVVIFRPTSRSKHKLPLFQFKMVTILKISSHSLLNITFKAIIFPKFTIISVWDILWALKTISRSMEISMLAICSRHLWKLKQRSCPIFSIDLKWIFCGALPLRCPRYWWCWYRSISRVLWHLLSILFNCHLLWSTWWSLSMKLGVKPPNNFKSC